MKRHQPIFSIAPMHKDKNEMLNIKMKLTLTTRTKFQQLMQHLKSQTNHTPEIHLGQTVHCFPHKKEHVLILNSN